ncbi:hypothetical protein D3C76_1419690 [compost metagenome]
MQGDLAEGAGGAEDQHLLALLDCSLLQRHDGPGGGDAHADSGLVVHLVRHLPHLGGGHQSTLGPGSERRHRALAKIHAAAVGRAAHAFATDHAGIFHAQTIGAQHIPAAEACGVDVDQYRAVLRLGFTEIAHHRRGIAFGNHSSAHTASILLFHA